MTEVREHLERGVVGLEPSPVTSEQIQGIARGRHRRARVLTAVVTLAVAAAATSVLVASFSGGHGRHTPAQSSAPPGMALDPTSLQPEWTADVPQGYIEAELPHDATHVFLVDGESVVAYPIDCADQCAPSWRGDVRSDDLIRTEIVVGDGVVVATSMEGTWAFGADCASDGSTCPPLWTASPPLGYFTAPLVSGEVVRVEYGFGESEQHHSFALGFDVHCRTDGGACQPLWQADLGFGSAFVPGTERDGVFYQQVGSTMTGFRATCGTDGAECQPVFSVTTDVDPSTDRSAIYGPTAVGDQLVLSFGDGRVASYGVGCGTGCTPLWSGAVGPDVDQAPALAGRSLVVSRRHAVVAFPTTCATDGGACAPEWGSNAPGAFIVDYTDDAHVVAIDHFANQAGISVFPSDCAGACTPRWTASPPADVQGVTSDGSTLYVGLADGTVAAYQLDCSGECSPVWTADVGSRDNWNLLLAGNRLVVVSGESGRPGEHIAVFSGSIGPVPDLSPAPLPSSQPSPFVLPSITTGPPPSPIPRPTISIRPPPSPMGPSFPLASGADWAFVAQDSDQGPILTLEIGGRPRVITPIQTEMSPGCSIGAVRIGDHFVTYGSVSGDIVAARLILANGDSLTLDTVAMPSELGVDRRAVAADLPPGTQVPGMVEIRADGSTVPSGCGSPSAV